MLRSRGKKYCKSIPSEGEAVMHIDSSMVRDNSEQRLALCQVLQDSLGIERLLKSSLQGAHSSAEAERIRRKSVVPHDDDCHRIEMSCWGSPAHQVPLFMRWFKTGSGRIKSHSLSGRQERC